MLSGYRGEKNQPTPNTDNALHLEWPKINAYSYHGMHVCDIYIYIYMYRVLANVYIYIYIINIYIYIYIIYIYVYTHIIHIYLYIYIYSKHRSSNYLHTSMYAIKCPSSFVSHGNHRPFMLYHRGLGKSSPQGHRVAPTKHRASHSGPHRKQRAILGSAPYFRSRNTRSASHLLLLYIKYTPRTCLKMGWPCIS